jgi:hypothetical protein
MLSRTEAGATSGIVSTGCATMISPECALADSLVIGIQRVRQEIDVELVVVIVFPCRIEISENAGVSQMITSG